ncbi:NFACT family protein [Wolbachia endosymbiont of Oedothorax gibbosus]|uniref:NFACT family protein n=1 Tax=Wolbachia endosymbiont of Oedothorax gibbosus TaxID=931100 RepID=UPI002024DB78|nr:NFACT family protein [Wolbachia endosymbiont of Oedothorax gibbosus]
MTNNFETNEDFFRDFWPTVDEEVKKERLEQESLILKREAEKRKKLEQELLTLKKRELYRKYASLVTMVPFALFMAIELEKTCSDQVLLGVISGALSHTILPFMVLSLICTLYLIYNNRKIAQKERELENIENGEEVKEKEHNISDIGQCLIYIEAITTALVIVGMIMGEASSLEAAEDAILFLANAIAFLATLVSYIDEHEKNKKKETEKSNLDEKSSKKTSNMSVAGLALAGSSIFLIRRIMLMALTSSLNPAVGPTLGLIGIALFMVIQILTIRSYSKTLKDPKVEGQGKSRNAGSSDRSYKEEGPAIA